MQVPRPALTHNEEVEQARTVLSESLVRMGANVQDIHVHGILVDQAVIERLRRLQAVSALRCRIGRDLLHLPAATTRLDPADPVRPRST